MKLIISTIIALFFVSFIFSNKVFSQFKVLINEFLIDPQPQSVEVFNSGTESADISDWIIDDSGGTTFYTIPKNNIIFPNQCLVFSGDFNLNKTSVDTVRLINNFQQLIDSFSYKSSSGTGITFFRFPDNNNYWTTGSANLGFYNQTNISCLMTPSPTLTLTPTPTLTITPTLTPMLIMSPIPTETSTPIPTPIPQSYDNIYISEVMVNPPTGGKEWAEIYNNNDFPVSLNNWYLDDIENAGSTPRLISLEIEKKSYAVFDLSSSIFNNSGDSVRLLDFNKNLKDSFEYLLNEQGKSLGRTSLDSDDFCLQEPSKNLVNNSCINPTPTIITPVTTGQINLSPTIIKSIPSNKPVSINQLIDTKNLTPIEIKTSGQVLGTSNELIINSLNNRPLINLLTILSFSYSLLTISSILFKMKLSYGKNQKIYSSPLYSS